MWTCGSVEARPGNFLVPVRRPHVLAHLVGALRAAGDRDVVAMTVRLVGVDVPDDPTQDPRATEDERRLLSAVIAAAEREGRAVRLMIVPGVNVFDSVDRNRAAPRSRRRFTSANRKRCRPTTRRGCSATPGSARASRPASTSAWSSITRAAARPPITWARTRPRSVPKTSNTSTGSGSTSSEPSVPACTTTMWCAQR